MKDIRNYFEAHLSLAMLDDEYFVRCQTAESFDDIKRIVDDEFLYNDEQLETLRKDFEAGMFE